MDRYLVTGALGLAAFQIFYLLGDLGLISSPFHSNGAMDSRQIIGHISSKRSQVKQKNISSVVWKNSNKNDPLHKNDAILTLDNSNAQLKLHNNVQVDIFENTLVVLDTTTSDLENDPLRIRFQRGILISQNPVQSLKVGSGNWTLSAVPGSALSLRSLADDKIEVEVKEGKVQLKHKEDSNAIGILTKGERTKLNKEKLSEVTKLSEDMKFINPPQSRIYSHHFPYKLDLDFKGKPTRLRIITPKRKIKYVDLTSNSTQLLLKSGTYGINLESETKTSPVYLVEILPAPRIVYTKPLPRDRIPYPGPHVFSWLPIENIMGYEIRIQSSFDKNSEIKKIKAPHSIQTFSFEKQGRFQWDVQAHDSDGYVIPPFYDIPFYSVKNPLAAPKLQGVRDRKPASDKKQKKKKKKPDQSMLEKIWNALVPRLYAQEVEQRVIFSWFPVSGADHYIIEVSEKPDFIRPVLIEKVRDTEFIWTDFDMKNYHWRVAAGTDNGQMGVFSEAQGFDVRELKDLKPGEMISGIRFENFEKTKDKPKPLAKPKPQPAPKVQKEDTKKAEKPIVVEKAKGVWRARLQTHYWMINQEAPSFDGNYEGFSFPSLHVTYINDSFDLPLWLEMDLTRLEWKPKDEDKWPYQTEFSTYVIQLKLLKHGKKWNQGLTVWRMPLLERSSFEKLEAKNTHLFGYLWQRFFELSSNKQWEFNVGLSYGDELFMPYLQNVYHFPMNYWGKTDLDLGIRLDLMGYTDNDELSGHFFRFGLDIGF